MTVSSSCMLLRIYIGRKELSRGTPVYETIMWEAKSLHLGATLIAGLLGIGHVGALQRAETLNDDLPVIIDVIDTPQKISSFIPVVAKLLGNHGLMTTSTINVVHRGILMPHAHIDSLS